MLLRISREERGKVILEESRRRYRRAVTGELYKSLCKTGVRRQKAITLLVLQRGV